MTISHQPCYVGQTYPSWDIPLTAGGVADDISSVDITKFFMLFHPTTGSDFTGTGTFIVKNAYPAEVYYKPSPADVSASFNGQLYIYAYFPPTNTNVDEPVYDPISFVISPK